LDRLPVTASMLGWRSKLLFMEIRRMGIAQQEYQYIVNTLFKLRITPCSTLFPACYTCERAPYSHVPNPVERACIRRETRCLRVVHILMTDSSVDLKKPSIHRGCEQRGFSRLHLALDVNYLLHPCHHPLRFLNLRNSSRRNWACSGGTHGGIPRAAYHGGAKDAGAGLPSDAPQLVWSRSLTATRLAAWYISG